MFFSPLYALENSTNNAAEDLCPDQLARLPILRAIRSLERVSVQVLVVRLSSNLPSLFILGDGMSSVTSTLRQLHASLHWVSYAFS